MYVSDSKSKREYKELINPKILFSSIEEVKEFLNIECTKEDLLCFLELCEKEECYEYCTLIVNKINLKFRT